MLDLQASGPVLCPVPADACWPLSLGTYTVAILYSEEQAMRNPVLDGRACMWLVDRNTEQVCGQSRMATEAEEGGQRPATVAWPRSEMGRVKKGDGPRRARTIA